jgi:hypothetical protein
MTICSKPHNHLKNPTFAEGSSSIWCKSFYFVTEIPGKSFSKGDFLLTRSWWVQIKRTRENLSQIPNNHMLAPWIPGNQADNNLTMLSNALLKGRIGTTTLAVVAWSPLLSYLLFLISCFLFFSPKGDFNCILSGSTWDTLGMTLQNSVSSPLGCCRQVGQEDILNVLPRSRHCGLCL